MKRQIAIATAFSAALAVGAAAQTGTPQQQPPQQQQSQRGEQVTMTGCLERATPSGTAGTTGTAGTAGQAEFILSHASRSGASGTAGTTGEARPSETRPSTMGDNKYRLMGGDREDLQKYLNSKVEIRGTLDRSSMSTGAGTGTGTGTGATGTRAGQTDTDKLPILRVTSVRQVSPTCDDK